MSDCGFGERFVEFPVYRCCLFPFGIFSYGFLSLSGIICQFLICSGFPCCRKS